MSKALDESDIDKLAALARVSVTPSERAGLAKDIEAILGYVSELDSVDVVEGTREKERLHNITREDSFTHESGAYTQAILEASPKSEEGYVVVKKVL